MNAETMRLINPIAEQDATQVAIAPRLATLSGKRIGFINTGKPKVEHFLAEIETLMRAQYPDITAKHVRKDFTSAKPIAHELEGAVDAVVNAWGD